MSLLLKEINQVNDVFRRAGSFNSDIGMFSGFTALDVASANLEHLPETNLEILNGGMFNNPYNEIGMSAVGKTTLWIQVISACMDNWYNTYGPVTECIFYNVENHTSPQRWMDITGYDEQMMRERVRFVSKPYTIVEIYNELATLAKQKKAMRKQLEIDTGIISIDGGTVKTLPTTYVLIDSIAAIRSDSKTEFDKDGNVKDTGTIAGTSNMDAMQIAKDNTMFINEVKKLCEEVKICVVMINHLVEVPVLDRYNPPKPILPSMKYNQKLKGGNELIYQSFGVNMLSIRERLFNEKSKVFGDSVHGLIAFMEWLKNKNGPEGIKYPMVFDSATGYKPELSDFEMLYSEGSYGISGSPLNYHLDILPEISFTRKTLLEKCHQNPILARAMCFTARVMLICDLILHCERPDLKNLTDCDFNTRINMIMRYSIDYPGYVNHGWVVDESLIEETGKFNDMLGNSKRFNVVTNLFEIFINSVFDLDYVMCDNNYSPFGKSMKIGDNEYYLPDGVSKW